MKVELTSHVAINLATGREQTIPQYRILVDGDLVGYKGWKFGSPCCFIGRFLSPADKIFIQEEIEGMIGDRSKGIEPMENTLDDNQDTEDYHDDFTN